MIQEKQFKYFGAEKTLKPRDPKYISTIYSRVRRIPASCPIKFIIVDEGKWKDRVEPTYVDQP